jgi:hypothetical protein
MVLMNAIEAGSMSVNEFLTVISVLLIVLLICVIKVRKYYE